MKKIVYPNDLEPELVVLGGSKQPNEPVYTLCLLPLPSQDLFLLYSNKRNPSLFFVTAESAKNLLNEEHFYKTQIGLDWLS